LQHLKQAHLLIAMKANNNVRLHHHISPLVYGADIASHEELDIALEAKYKHISVTSPLLRGNDLITLLNRPITFFNFDNIHQFHYVLDHFNEISNSQVSYGIRVKIPSVSSEQETYFSNSRFGFSELDIHNNLYKFSKISIETLHVHVGELNNLENFEIICDYLNYLVPLFPNLKNINFGGGFLSLVANYNLNILFLKINEIISKKGNLHSKQIFFEPGFFVFITCGYLLTSVINFNPDEKWLSVDASAWNLVNWNYPFVIPTDVEISDKYTIYGNTCYEHDCFCTTNAVGELTINKKLLLFPFGAYVNSMHRNMHGQKLPQEILIE
jgi:diaminopimelate decarboxylase